jgi:organic radical activating enzyme
MFTPNTQPQESIVREGDGLTLDLHSIFLTLQGEGPFTGHRAVFVRLAGCNLQCPGCDTEYTQGRATVSIHDIASSVDAFAAGKPAIVVITGGEPLRQPIGALVYVLMRKGFNVQIESNGTVAPDDKLHSALIAYGRRVTLVVSPKTKQIARTCLEKAAAFKYVLDHRHVSEADGLPTVALEYDRAAGDGVARPREGAPVYVTPYDAKDDDDEVLNRMMVGDVCRRYGYIAGVQLHKLMDLA